MDYSKLTPEQLLEILKTQSPRMYDALSTPLDCPEEFPFYDPDPISDLGFDGCLFVSKIGFELKGEYE